MKKWHIYALLLILIFVFSSCKQTPKREKDVSTAIPESVSITSGEGTIPQQTDELGKLKFAGTTINDVVMQADDNDYFLRRNEKGQENVWGCYFMDYECTPKSKNIIIYGHSLDDSSEAERFSQLKKLNNPEFAKKNSTIELEIAGEKRQYKIVSAGYANTLTEWVVITANPNTQEFKQIIELTEKRSVLAEKCELKESDKILTLSTCTTDKEVRYLVVAKLI